MFGSGGHQRQMAQLAGQLVGRYEIVGIFTREDFVAAKLREYRHYYVKRPRISDEWYVLYFLKTLYCFLQSIMVIAREWPAAIVSCGPSTAAPVMYAGKLLGRKIIFIESWSKISTKSKTGNMIYPIADMFFVQWNEQLKLYPKALFRGRLGT